MGSSATSAEEGTGKSGCGVVALRRSPSPPPIDEQEKPLTFRPIVDDSLTGQGLRTATNSDNGAVFMLNSVTWYPCTSPEQWETWQSTHAVIARVMELSVSWEGNPDDGGSPKRHSCT